VELQADVNLTENTALKAAYTHNRSRQDITDTQTIRTPLLPNNQVSLWVSHRFDLPNAQKLTVAGGARYNGATEDQRYYPGERISGYTLLDLMVRYDINRNWGLQVNARNLTDKKYVSGCDFYCYYGGGRTLDVQLQYQWR
jgi:iron complex outermembrane receptor protein